MREKILAIVAEETGKPVTDETTIEQLGIESLEFLDLLLKVQEVLGIDIPDRVISHVNTMGDLVKAAEGTLVTI